MRSLKQLLLNSGLLLLTAGIVWGNQMSGGDFILTKDLLGAVGPSVTPTADSADYSLAFAWGEPVSGNTISEPTYNVMSGYFGGGFGNGLTFKVLSSVVGAPGVKTFYQDGLQVGLPFNAPITITFSDQLNDVSISSGVQVVLLTDHLGNSTNSVSSFTYVSDSNAHTLTLSPVGAWQGNSLYDVQLTPNLLSVDGFPLDTIHHIYFLTQLDHRQENVVLDPIIPAAQTAGLGSGSISAMSIDIPTESLSDFSTVLLSRDPLSSPLHVDPKIIQEANDKARAAGGAYRVPIAIQEITAYNTQGNLMGPLSKPAMITLDYGTSFNAPGATASLIRPQTLSLWVLDTEHSLWVKMPATQNAVGIHTVAASVAYFSVYALMGSPDGSASDSFAFPVPWRPHGPNAGTGAGQTGTEADGILFSNLPSECTLSIYTISGDRVRQIHHTDTAGLIGQERWDVKTTHGEPVASGVYLWRVESSVDGKNGKLMVIR